MLFCVCFLCLDWLFSFFVVNLVAGPVFVIVVVFVLVVFSVVRAKLRVCVCVVSCLCDVVSWTSLLLCLLVVLKCIFYVCLLCPFPFLCVRVCCIDCPLFCVC